MLSNVQTRLGRNKIIAALVVVLQLLLVCISLLVPTKQVLLSNEIDNTLPVSFAESNSTHTIIIDVSNNVGTVDDKDFLKEDLLMVDCIVADNLYVRLRFSDSSMSRANISAASEGHYYTRTFTVGQFEISSDSIIATLDGDIETFSVGWLYYADPHGAHISTCLTSQDANYGYLINSQNDIATCYLSESEEPSFSIKDGLCISSDGKTYEVNFKTKPIITADNVQKVILNRNKGLDVYSTESGEKVHIEPWGYVFPRGVVGISEFPYGYPLSTPMQSVVFLFLFAGLISYLFYKQKVDPRSPR